jgi:NitT/TauT family transport system ATP-binding protein
MGSESALDRAAVMPQARDREPIGRAEFIQVRDIVHVFSGESGAVRALGGVTLNVRAGEFLSIVGPSGCGKSTLVMLIAGLLRPTAGRIEIGGREITGPHTDLGIVFQNPVLLAWRTALDNVLLQIEMRGLDRGAYRARALSLLDNIGLQGFERRLPHELSGGMRQRVAICRALIHNPPLLLMDEPFGALDALTRDQVALDIQNLYAGDGKTVVFITHSIEEAVFLSDRVVVMTPRPGRLDAVIDIELKRPRPLGVREEGRFVDYARLIRERFVRSGVLHDIAEGSSR